VVPVLAQLAVEAGRVVQALEALACRLVTAAKVRQIDVVVALALLARHAGARVAEVAGRTPLTEVPVVAWAAVAVVGAVGVRRVHHAAVGEHCLLGVARTRTQAALERAVLALYAVVAGPAAFAVLALSVALAVQAHARLLVAGVGVAVALAALAVESARAAARCLIVAELAGLAGVAAVGGRAGAAFGGEHGPAQVRVHDGALDGQVHGEVGKVDGMRLGVVGRANFD